MDEFDAQGRLLRLEPGVHHAASEDTGVWVMVGRSLPKPVKWSSIPPAASLSVVWGEGGCTMRHRGRSIALEPGHMMWLDAGHPHRGVGWEGSDFATAFIPTHRLSRRLGPRALGLTIAPASARLRFAMRVFVAIVLEGSRAELELPALEALLDHAAVALGPTEAEAEAPANLRRARRLLELRFLEDIDLSTLALEAGLSTSSFSRRFSEVWDISPIQYRKQLRLRAATRMIAVGQSITAAALRSGFSDTAHLSRTFAAQYGIAPSQWQRRVGGIFDPGA